MKKMKKMTRSMLALLLCIIMVLNSSMSISAAENAEELSVIENVAEEEPVEEEIIEEKITEEETVKEAAQFLVLASDEPMTDDDLKEKLEAGEEVSLEDDITISEDLSITISSAVELDLNGYTITVDERDSEVFTISSEGQFTVSDSESEGKITGSNEHLFLVNGTLKLTGGSLEDNTAAPVKVNAGGKFEMSGGSVSDNENAAGNGAGVYSKGGTITISGGELAGNKAKNGGAVFCEETDLTVSGGQIKGNEATEGSGGGIYAKNSKVKFSNGTIGGVNHSDLVNFDKSQINEGNYAAKYAGGLYLTGSTLDMTGGTVAGNVSIEHEGGGITFGGGSYGSITGGEITNNRTYTDQHWGGGGIFCSDGCTLYLENILVTENAAGGFGGGLAGCSTGRTFLFADHGGAVFDNTAAGAHVSGDQSGKSADHEYGIECPIFMSNGYADFFSAYINVAYNTMLGGGFANWSGSIDRQPIDLREGEGGVDALTSSFVMGLTAHPTEEAKAAAESEARVRIYGNYSYTHGGGILCNGYMIVGRTTQLELSKSLENRATKNLLDKDDSSVLAEEGKQFTFHIKDENGNVVSAGKNDANGNIAFQTMLKFNSDNCQGEGPWTHVFYMSEADEVDNIKADSTIYKIIVGVAKTKTNETIGLNNIEITRYDIVSLEIEESQDGLQWSPISESQYEYTERGENHWDTLNIHGDSGSSNPDDTSAFVNRKYEPVTIDLEASKKLTGRSLEEGEFEFVLSEVETDSEGNEQKTEIMTAVNTEEGSIRFEDLQYDVPGEYTYEITEKEGTLGGVDYDDTVYEVTVTVVEKENADGEWILEAAAEYPEGGITYENVYKAKGSLHLKANKTLKNRTLTDDKYTFEVLDKDGNVILTARNKADGTIRFGAIKYTEKDAGKEFVYKVREKQVGSIHTTYDETVYTVEVKVEDNKDGTLDISKDIYKEEKEVQSISFVNVYRTPTQKPKTPTTTPKPINTGDSSQTGLYIALMGAAVMTLIAADKKRKKM